jgi:Arc/MetJ family transcription regulator
MRTTLDLDDALLRDATSAIARDHLEKNEPVPVYTKTFVVESALRALLREHAARRLSRMFGAAAGASAPPRRRAKVCKES